MRVEQEKVEQFHARYEQDAPETPTLREHGACLRRYELGKEELGEYMDAVVDSDLVKIADSLADQLYILLGTAVFHGIDLQPIFEEVHRSNMTKDHDPNSFKHAVKGPTYEPPRIAELLLMQSTGLTGEVK